ncbi:hypothetical protein J6590_025430 [Homalodisca vitripennis]|nr:hypothetical protein J6590_025430 [Homalodisca vitripennis]
MCTNSAHYGMLTIPFVSQSNLLLLKVWRPQHPVVVSSKVISVLFALIPVEHLACFLSFGNAHSFGSAIHHSVNTTLGVTSYPTGWAAEALCGLWWLATVTGVLASWTRCSCHLRHGGNGQGWICWEAAGHRYLGTQGGAICE